MSGLSASGLTEKWVVSVTGLHVRRCENCGHNTTRRDKKKNGFRYECSNCKWAVRDFPPGHNRSTAEPLPLFKLMAEPELTPLPELTPFIPKEKKDYADQVTRWQAERDGWIEPEPRVSTPAPVEQKPLTSAQAQDDISAFFPANVEPTEWLRVDAVAAGFGYGGEEPCDSCNASILACKREFRIKYLDPSGGGKWYKRCGANTYYSRQLIEAFSKYRGRVFDWDDAIAVSPIVDAPPQTKARRASPIKAQVTEAIQPASSEPSHAIDQDSRAIVNTPRSALQPEHREPSHGIDPNIAPTLAEFAAAVADGKLPAPDVEFMGIPLYRAYTLSLFKTGGARPKDFTEDFAFADRRILSPVVGLNPTTGLPLELSALAEYSGVEFYRVEGATDHRLAIGIKAGGRNRDEGTLRHALARHGFIMKPQETHLVTAWLALDYLGDARYNNKLASQVKGIKDRGLERQLNSEASRLEDPAVGSDGMKAALPSQFIPELKAEFEKVTALIVRGQDENKKGFDRIEATILKLQSTINNLEHWEPTGYQESVEWLAKINNLENGMASIGGSVEEIRQQLGEELRNKRDRVSEKVRDLHVRFVHFRYHGHCPVTNAKIVGEDPRTGDPALLDGKDGKPLGQVDHNFQVNRAGKLSTWLIESNLNQKLNHDEKERIKVQTYFTAYQQSLEEYDFPLLNRVLDAP